MAQAWVCNDCSYLTADPREAGDHERDHNGGDLCRPGHYEHFMEDVGE
jgi:hypothetical protein